MPSDVYKGMEAQCISTYRKCVAILKSVKDYEEIETIAPELSDSASMKEIGFAVELLLSIVRSEESFPGFPFGMRRQDLQDKMDEARERLEERLEEIREKYEEKLEQLEEEDYDNDDECDDEPKV